MQYKEQRFIIPIPYELLYELYVIRHTSTKAIAELLHCSQSTVCQRLHTYKIPIQSKLVSIPQEELMLLYQQGHSVKQLAQHYHVSTRTIYNRLYDWHIKEPTRTQVDKDLPITSIISSYESGNSAYTIAKEFRISPSTVIHLLQSKRIPLRHSHKRLSLPIKDICNLYTAHKLSTTQIANLYHVKAATIASRLREAGITLRGNKEDLPIPSIVSAYQNDTPLQVIATTYGTNYHTIRNILIRNGVYQKARRIRDCAYDIQTLHRNEQLSIAEIASHYACHPETIRRIIKDSTKKKKSTP